VGVTGHARVAGVMGWPVKHSLSPRLHGYWLDHYGVDGAYVPLPVQADQLEQALRALPTLGIAGVNVTNPHKEAAFALMDTVSREAERIRAVNTIVVSGDGELSGTNTDVFGFVENLRSSCPNWSATNGPAVVLGAGGAARAALVALLINGAPEIRLVNRTAERAETVAEDLNAAFGDRTGGAIRAVPWAERSEALSGATLLVNTTSLGMAGQPSLDVQLEVLPSAAVVTDIVYTPLTTPLLAAAAAAGRTTVDGLGMLLYQARSGFAAWFGVDPDVTPELRVHVLAGMARR